MAEEDAERQPVNKPGTSCLGCRRRKLKCTRETEGCQNCVKADLPCVYPTPEVGVKRKRGPYKKDKPARQRHLEDLVRYLEPKNSSSEANVQQDTGSSGQSASPANVGQTPPAPSDRPSFGRPSLHSANSEDLVKDALIALTKSSVSEHESRQDDGVFLSHNYALQQGSEFNVPHPPIRRILEYWQIFVTRVDPMTKVIHAPSFGKRLFSVIDNLGTIPSSTEAMLFSIYYAAVSSCTARECRIQFGESQATLMSRYGRNIEAALGENHEVPALEALQALVLYLICIRRQHDGTNARTLWQLGVRSAQMVGAHEDPEGKYPPFEAEMRRRAWCHLHGLENSAAEAVQSRGKSIMSTSNVKLPSNLNDDDLYPDMTEAPRARIGITDMTFPTLRFEIHRLVSALVAMRRQQSSSWNHGNTLRESQMMYLDQAKARFCEQYTNHMDPSRPYDWMCLMFVEGMLIKAQLVIDFPLGTTPTKTMPADERMCLLKSSVGIISITRHLSVDDRISGWLWYFRGFVQWHSLAIVVAELSWNANPEFADFAWQVLDPIFADWDRLYRMKRDEPAWVHVNSMIERARHLRRQRPKQSHVQKRNKPNNAAKARPSTGIFPDPTLMGNTSAAAPSFEPSDASAAQGLAALAATEGSLTHDTSGAPSYHVPTPESIVQGPPPSQYSHTTPMMNFDINFAPSAENFDSVDFGAFDAVFGSASWDSIELLDHVNAQLEEVERHGRAHDEMGRG
ncbi:aurofusarin cluster transcription factor aurR2-like [Lecanosticta acicola]|uniref:Aurofusarin cluster transcription factor aurR2-like n=1 Tax=Lecanosticta acicola TaxID=111012 RepID=A0AAI8Z1K9_9PEZI|nr:aurofusarin cluster transcription factor aurR2-like [Lecanosticta acicola]